MSILNSNRCYNVLVKSDFIYFIKRGYPSIPPSTLRFLCSVQPMLAIRNHKLRLKRQSHLLTERGHRLLIIISLVSHLFLLFHIIAVAHYRNGSNSISQPFPRYNLRCSLQEPSKSHLCRSHAVCTPELL